MGLFKCQGRSRKQFSPLWRSCEARTNLFMCGKDLKKPFNLRLCAVKHVQASSSAREGRESSFHRFGGRVRLVHTCLCARNLDYAV